MLYFKSFFRYHFYLFLSLVFSLALCLVRIIYTGEITYFFLVWNLYLAFIPFFLSDIFPGLRTGGIKFKSIFLLAIIILFLPNAPYILTDLFHLRLHGGSSIWYDSLLIISFAWNGMLLFLHTLNNLKNKFLGGFNSFQKLIAIVFLIFISAFGIYLGRYLRFNSWDLIINPAYLFKEILFRFIKPTLYPLTWSMTFTYFGFLTLAYFNFPLKSKKYPA